MLKHSREKNCETILKENPPVPPPPLQTKRTPFSVQNLSIDKIVDKNRELKTLKDINNETKIS